MRNTKEPYAIDNANEGRFGISLLSKKNFLTAWDEEVLIEKSIGDVLIKTKEHDIISFNHLARKKQHLDQLEIVAQLLGIKGLLYSIELDNSIRTFPEVVPFDTQLFDPKATLQKTFSRFLFSIDATSVIVEAGKFTTNTIDPLVTINIELLNGETLVDTLIITEVVSVLNNRIYKVNDLLTDKETPPVYDSISISVMLPTQEGVTDIIRNIVNGVYLIIE